MKKLFIVALIVSSAALVACGGKKTTVNNTNTGSGDMNQGSGAGVGSGEGTGSGDGSAMPEGGAGSAM